MTRVAHEQQRADPCAPQHRGPSLLDTDDSWPQPQSQPSGALRCIVTGMEHTGTTVTSELIMSAPGLIGAFETGFLLAPTPGEFALVHPWYSWLNYSTATGSLGLHEPQVSELLASASHAAMYEYVMRASPLARGSRQYVDKTPRYYTQLAAVMDRAPGVPVVHALVERNARRQ